MQQNIQSSIDHCVYTETFKLNHIRKNMQNVGGT